MLRGDADLQDVEAVILPGGEPVHGDLRELRARMKEAFVADTAKKAVLKPKSEKTAPAAAPAESADDSAETTEA